MNGRTSSADKAWEEIESWVTRSPNGPFNTAYESCGRYSTDRGKLALTVCHPGGDREQWTHFELDRVSARAAQAFHRAGLRPGDRIAGLVSRQVESWIVALAAWRSGLIYVPLFCGFGVDALAHRLKASGASLLVVDHRWRENADAAMRSVDLDIHVVTVAGPRATGLRRGDYSFWAEVERSSSTAPEVETHGKDIATLLFTSGTTGQPKACLIPHSGLLSVLPFVRFGLGATRETSLFATSDPAWAYGLYTTGVAPMALGVHRVIYSGDFDPAAWWEVVRNERVSSLTSAPTAYRRLVSARRDADRYGLRLAAAAGEPLDQDTARTWRDVTSGLPIHNGYGLSELGMILADPYDSQPSLTAGSLGQAVPGFDVLLVDDQGVEIDNGGEGNIAVRRPRYQLSAGYEGDDEAWSRRWAGDLFVTDDRAVIDPVGRWRFVGRGDDMIVTAGYNVGPVEVESVLLEQPGVAEAAVVPAADAAKGQVIRAVIVRSAGAPADDVLVKQLRDAVAERIGRHAAPKIVDFTDTLPRNEVGKIRRTALRTAVD